MANKNAPEFIGKYLVWGEDEIAVYASEGVKYPVTDCCQATAKGTDWGTCCRVCYEEVDSMFGMYWDDQMWADDIASGRVVKAATK